MMREMSRDAVPLSTGSGLHWSWLILSVLTLLAAFLRLWHIQESLWVDELHTSWCLQGGLDEVAERATIGNQSPLYFYLMWAITSLLGESELTLRLPSLVAGIALPGAAYLLARRTLPEETRMPPLL